MGYSTVFYAIDLSRLRSALGSKDEHLLQAIAKANSDQIEESNEWFEDEIDEGAPSLSDALRQLVMGEPLDDDSGFMYAYATELLVSHLGERLDVDDIGWVSDLKLDSPLDLDHRIPVEIPQPADFPSFSHLTRDELQPQLETIQRVMQADTTDEDGLNDLRQELHDALHHARKKKLDVVTFTY